MAGILKAKMREILSQINNFICVSEKKKKDGIDSLQNTNIYIYSDNFAMLYKLVNANIIIES
jgi:hypothetical protein